MDRDEFYAASSSDDVFGSDDTKTTFGYFNSLPEAEPSEAQPEVPPKTLPPEVLPAPPNPDPDEAPLLLC
jgi:hypothetical protein